MISRVHIIGYKSLADVTIDLKPLTVIIGPNAAGKSNLFDALGLLSRMATRKTLREAFEDHRGLPTEAFHLGEAGLEGLLSQRFARFTIQADVQLTPEVVESVERRIRQMQDGVANNSSARSARRSARSLQRWSGRRARRRIEETLLRYSLTVEIAPSTGFLRVADERLVALSANGTVNQRRAPFIEKVEGKLRLRLEGQARPTDHDIGLDYTLVSQPLYPPHYPHLTAFKEELSRWHFYYLEPDAMRREVPPGEVLNLQRDGADLAAFFKTLQARSPRQFDDLNHALPLLLPDAERLDLEATREGLLQLKIIEKGTSFPAHLISEGTLRVLGLLAITNPLAQSSVIGYEEPENGVHPRRLKLIADLLSNAAEQGMQVLVNTHSPILPDYFPDAALFICRRRQRRTEFIPFTSPGPLLRAGEIETALEDQTPLYERIIRGDFDA
jgi:predicted ATPase